MIDADRVIVEWYDTKSGDKVNTILEVNCNGHQYQLVLNKNEINKKGKVIVEWFDKTKSKCEGENNG